MVMAAALVGRALYRDAATSGMPACPAVVMATGEVEEPGAYLLEGPEVSLSRVLAVAGGLRPDMPEAGMAKKERTLRNGEAVRVSGSGQGAATVTIEAMPAAARLTLGGKLDVNAASEEELLLVPQMKPNQAAAIVARRGQARWMRFEELKEISGVGPKTVERWKPYLDVTAGSSGGRNEQEP